MLSRRGFLHATATSAVTVTAISGRVQAAAIPEAATTKDVATQPPFVPPTGADYNPVVTLNGWTLPWRMNGDWKEFHLVAEPVVREFAPGMKVYLWGYTASHRVPRSKPSRGIRSG